MASSVRYHKSAAGQLAFKQRSGEISARQRSVFLLFDGQRSVNEVLATTAGLGATQADVDDLIAKGFLEAEGSPAADSPRSLSDQTGKIETVSSGTPPVGSFDLQTLYQRAYPVATRLTASLGLRGFRLNLAVEAASGYEDLVALLPQITQAVGAQAALELRKALNVS